ncbi:hypothetical protein F4778DRAFT_739038 [Xylariomycetidae sp. FL2044]|nr:hypothetical protein F4778DRAFT_739038 [Xylariomycetidae sp. FL2044]
MYSACLLSTFLAWDQYERWVSRNNAKRYQPWPLPAPSARKYETRDVSLIVPTIDWSNTFVDFMVTWLSSKPGEIIIVTVNALAGDAQMLVGSHAIQRARGDTVIRVLSIDHANKRDQLVHGINAAQGQIIGLVDDDALWRSEVVLQHLLAPFEDDDVGLVGVNVTSYIPRERQDPAVISPWEVAALRIRHRRIGSTKGAFAADGGINFSVSGLTMLLRAEIVRSPDFQRAFTTERFMGVTQHSGDDAFITRWVLFSHMYDARADVKQWRLAMQIVPEAEISTSLLPDRRFAGQQKRWSRTGLRTRLIALFQEPGFRPMRATTPYMARKMAEGLVNPPLLILRLVLWCLCLRACLPLAVFVTLQNVYNRVSGLRSFAREFPYCRSKIWAAALIDNLYLISDWYCWSTLATETWTNRPRAGEGMEAERGEETLTTPPPRRSQFGSLLLLAVIFALISVFGYWLFTQARWAATNRVAPHVLNSFN